MGGVRVGLGNSEIDFDGFDVFMAEDILQGPEVGLAAVEAVPEKVDGERMAEAVDANAGDACASPALAPFLNFQMSVGWQRVGY